EHEADGDADEPDGERDAGTIDDAREHVAPEAVGAEEEERAALGRTDEVEAPLDQAPEAVGVAQAEEAEALDLGRIGGIDPAQGLHVEAGIDAVDEGPDEAAVVEEMHGLGRGVEEVRIAR